MLTILAWTVFIPAAFWNFLFWISMIQSVMEYSFAVWAHRRNLRDSALTLALLLIPGVYLFGWV